MCDLDCGSCGQTFNACRLDGLAYDSDGFTCTDCGAVNAIGVDGDGEDVDVYVSDSRRAAVRESAEVITEER